MVVPPAPRRQLSKHPNEPGRHPSPSDVPKLAEWLVYQGYTKGMSNFGGDDRIMEAKEFLILTEMEGNVKVWGLGEWKAMIHTRRVYCREKSIKKGCFVISAS